jgi:S-methylmethionine-dependent homocysteine/selenocysteine methylase
MAGGANGITIMDGGMGGELLRRSTTAPTGLWSAQALIDSPETVALTHRAYIDAGSRFITSNSYSSIPSYLSKAGLEERYQELTALAGELARSAAEAGSESVRVAGGLPPLSESYRADLAIADEEARPIYRAMARALEPNVDLFLCETMSCIRESRTAAEAAREAGAARGLPVYVSWTLDEEPGAGLRSGESIADAVAALRDLEIDGFLFNCTHPAAIERGLEILADCTDRPRGGYPNRFEVPQGWTLDNDISVEIRAGFGTAAFVEAARRCVERGATLFGGCCGIGPEDIAALAEAFPPPSTGRP